MRGALMVCGTSSDVGKSQIVAGLCRILARQGVRVAPFKAQNMALNSYVTSAGHEIGRAQAMQAMAAGVEPDVTMNPILLKPTGERTSQVVVMGRPWQTLDAVAYHRSKPELRSVVAAALANLRSRYDVVLLEGAGSPAEINLLDHDLVNLGLASALGIPAVVVGDIDRGGVFAALFGTVALLPDELRRWVRGFVINKFRGDPALLAGGVEQLEQRCGVPTFGVLPFAEGLTLDSEDSLALSPARPARPGRPSQHSADQATERGSVTGRACQRLDVAVIRFPRISNFTDVDALALEPEVAVRFVDRPDSLGDPDLVVLPGTKSTVEDLAWFRSEGFDLALDRIRQDGSGALCSTSPLILGICGGYQMLGDRIEDPESVESQSGTVLGLGLLDLRTVFSAEKYTCQRSGRAAWPQTGSALGSASDVPVTGYEIHHGRPYPGSSAVPWIVLGDVRGNHHEGVVNEQQGVLGTSLHGLLESDGLRAILLGAVADRRGKEWEPSGVSFDEARQGQIDRLADLCRDHLDLEALWRLVVEGGGGPPSGEPAVLQQMEPVE